MNIKNTTKAKKILSEIDLFIDYYQKAKKCDPARIQITKAQADAMGIKFPAMHKGIKVELE